MARNGDVHVENVLLLAGAPFGTVCATSQTESDEWKKTTSVSKRTKLTKVRVRISICSSCLTRTYAEASRRVRFRKSYSSAEAAQEDAEEVRWRELRVRPPNECAVPYFPHHIRVRTWVRYSSSFSFTTSVVHAFHVVPNQTDSKAADKSGRAEKVADALHGTPYQIPDKAGLAPRYE
nr:hypothetical protein CFP56_22029 [Quercus suber]